MTPEIPPRRLLDTRQLGGKVQPGQVVSFTTPTPARAAILNFTVTQPDGNGFLTAWGPGGKPNTSNVNYVTGQTVANLAVVPLEGNLFRFTVGGAAAHVVVDLQGVHG